MAMESIVLFCGASVCSARTLVVRRTARRRHDLDQTCALRHCARRLRRATRRQVRRSLARRGGDKLSGTIRLGDVSTDDNGVIAAVEREADSEFEILDPKIVSGKLRFQSEDADGSTIRYEMTPVDSTHADLQLLGTPVPIRPFRLKKL